MRITVFSDIHGNPYAAKAVLDAIKEDGPFDKVVFAGDLCFGGSDPAGCVDMIRESGADTVYGNTDEFIFANDETPPDQMHNENWAKFQVIGAWAAKRMGEERVKWLGSLAFEQRYSPTGNMVDDLLVVHANPKDVHGAILPPEEEQLKVVGEVKQPDDDPKLAEMLAGVEAAVMAHGHVHYTTQRRWGDLLMVNVAPCSVATYDGDKRARYTIFSWEDGAWQIERRYVEYDYGQEREALMASDMPDKEWWAKFFE